MKSKTRRVSRIRRQDARSEVQVVLDKFGLFLDLPIGPPLMSELVRLLLAWEDLGWDHGYVTGYAEGETHSREAAP